MSGVAAPTYEVGVPLREILDPPLKCGREVSSTVQTGLRNLKFNLVVRAGSATLLPLRPNDSE